MGHFGLRPFGVDVLQGIGTTQGHAWCQGHYLTLDGATIMFGDCVANAAVTQATRIVAGDVLPQAGDGTMISAEHPAAPLKFDAVACPYSSP